MDIARKTFEINNDVRTLDASDAIFKYDREEQRAILKAQPWTTDPHYFQEVKISAVALIKMVIHARSGGQYEIMGSLNGLVRDHTFYVIDTFALPVQGTETRVNAGNEAMEYMVGYQQGNEAVGKEELVVGWYHSHPGYGCWLSGIDVNTQSTNQKYNDPYLAVVIDPNRTVSAGKVEIGAFRTYPDNYTPPESASSEYQSIPLDKIEDFGAHAAHYYPLKVTVFKSSLDTKLLDLLWNKYWVNTLSQSTVITSREYNTAQLKDLTAKLSKTERDLVANKVGDKTTLTRRDVSGPGAQSEQDAGGKSDQRADIRWEEKDSALTQAAKDGARISAEAQHAMIAQSLKDRLFNSNLRAPPPNAAPIALSLAGQ